MPILDLKCKVVNKKIQYIFYKKEISNKRVILAESALPGDVKRASLTQEVIRRLRNTDITLPWSVKAEILSEFSNDLRRSGYTEKFRAQVISAGIAGFQKQCEASENGGTPLFRPLEYERPARIRKKAMAKEAWYRPNYDVVGFFPVTPGGVLASQIRKLVAKEGEKIGVKFKIVETPGPSIASQITRPDLSGCVYPNCNIEEGGASHLRRGANYTGSCQVSGVRTDTGGRLGLEVMPGSVERMDIRVATGSGIRKTVMSVEEGRDNRAELILFLIPVP